MADPADVEDRVDETRLRAIETLKRSMETLRTVITENQRLAHESGHEETGQQRVVDGEIELATLELELAALERGDIGGAKEVADAFPLPPPVHPPE
jgi:hypothetical protein